MTRTKKLRILTDPIAVRVFPKCEMQSSPTPINHPGAHRASRACHATWLACADLLRVFCLGENRFAFGKPPRGRSIPLRTCAGEQTAKDFGDWSTRTASA